jgi:TatD DNase family protein
MSAQLRLTDCHLHLQDPVLLERLDEVLDRARRAGVGRFVTNGSSEEDWPEVQRIAQAHPEIVSAFGLHPWFVAGRSPRWLETLEGHLRLVPSGVGEIGLDRWKKGLDERAQEEVFRAQLELARRLERPAMIHCVLAWDWLRDVLASEPPLPAGMLIHAFGGPLESIGPLAERGAWFSFAGDTLEERKTHKRAALAAAPRDRLLLETDAPDMLPPPPFRNGPRAASVRDRDGRERNEPSNLREVLRGLSALLGEREERLAEVIEANARRFLGGIAPPAERS